MKIESTRVVYVKRVVAVLFLTLTFALGYGQTTYTWIGGNGGNFATTTNWSPARPVAATSTDILVFNNTGTISVVGFTSQTIGQLQLLGNSDVIIQANATTQILSINGPALNNNLIVESGAILRLASTNTFTIRPLTTTNQRWDISGKVVVNANNTFNTSNATGNIATVSSTGSIDNNGGILTTSVPTLTFAGGSNYNHLATTFATYTIPAATWDAASNCNISTVTTATGLLGFNGQSFGHFTYNCPGQTAATFSLANSGTTTIKGNFNVINTGTGALVLGALSQTLNINGDLNISGGTFNLNSAATITTLNLAGNYNQTGGTLTKSGATSIAAVNFTGIGRTYIQSGGTVINTLINYAVNGAGASLTLNNNVSIAASRTFTASNGTLYCGTNIISGAGSFLMSSANAALGIGSPAGITAAVATLTGNIQTTGGRTFGTSANYIYTGANGQITGTGLPAAVAGYVMLNMSSPTDQLTFSTPGLTGAVTLRMVNGAVDNVLSFSNIGSTLSYEAPYAQTTTNNEFPGGTTTPGKLNIDNPNGVTMHASRWMRGTNDALKLVNGILYIPLNDTLTTSNTVATITGGSATSYVNGAISRNTGTATGLNFPIGKGAYNPVTISPTVQTGSLFITAEVFDADAGGTGSLGIASLNTNRYWKITKTGTGTLTSINTPSVTEYGLNAGNHICYSATVNGVYTMAPSTITGNAIAPNTSIPIPTGATNGDVNLVIGTGGTLSGIVPVGNSSGIQKLYQIAQLLNTSTLIGDVVFELQADYDGTTGEVFPINFYQYDTSGGSWTATVRPAAGATGLVTSGNPGSGVAFVAYNGVDNLSFDGRPGGTGNNVEWILRNTQPAGTATFTPTIQLLNDAGYNTLQYLQVEGQSLASNGTIAIGGTTGTKGNDYNTIQYCNIRDRSDIAGTPATGVYALGATTAGRENDHNVISYNNIYNQWANTGNIHGIYIDGYNSDYRVSNNSIYNSNRTPTGTLTYHGIRVGNTSAIYNCSVDSNFIGGTGKYAGGMQWIQNGSVNATLVGILVAGNTGTTHNIRYNKISNISWRSSYNATAAAPGTFCGIYTQNSSQNIENNVVGSGTGNDSIIVIATGSGSVTYGVAHTSSSGSLNIANNTIGSITAAASGSTISHGVSGIHVEASSGSYRNVTDNLVGSHVTPNSIQATSVSTGTAAQPVSGITIGSGSNGFLITGNTVANLRNAYSAVTAAGVTRGINILFGVGTVSDNTVHHISGNSTQTGVGTSAAVVGIAYSPSSTGNTFTGNIVHSINSTAPTAAVNVAGVVFNGSTTTNVVNVVERNLIHSLTLASSNGTATVTGLHIVAGVATFRNNMIRLGIDESGNSVAPTCSIIGINKATTSVNRIYYNSVYVGGSSVSAGTNTYAFRRTATGTIADTLRNNIFTNLRTGTGSANHIAIGFVASTGIIAANCNYNLFEVASTGGGRVGQVVSTPYATLSDWRTGTTFDANSYFGAAGFINPAGDAANVDLHINPAIPTQVEANATPVGSIVNDYDGDMRISPDIGADEGNFTPIDLTAPVISYTPFAGVCNDVTMHTVIVNISDASGVNTTPGLAPRIYYKKANDAINAYNGNTSGTSGWKYVETASTSSPFTFNIDLTLISGGISAGDAIQYVVVAQDMATPNPNNIGINSGTATFSGVPVSVTLASNGFPISGTPNQFVILPCSGTVTVGTGGNYGVFTTANGIFNAINQATLSGNLTVNVVSDIVNLEDGAVGLNQWAESGLGGYSVIIQSSANVLRTISGSSGVNAGLFRMNGADRVTFDGGTGANKFLVFRNTAVAPSASVFNFTNDATNITVNNCTIEGGAVSATGGVVVVGPAGAGSGNDNITITSCDIKDAASLPTNGIYSAGTTTAGKENSNVTISNCNIYNFFTPTAASSGILVATGSNTWSITNNRFYQTAVRTTTATGIIHSVIRINNTSGGGFNVSDNYIGGVDALGNGVMNYTSTQNAQMGVIYLSVASTPVSTVQNNTITNMLYTSISAATSVVGLYSGIYISAGNATISGNTIGSATGNGAITVTLNNTGTAALVAAIKSESTASININGNIIGGITCTGVGSNSGIGLYGIHFTVGTATVNGNLIGSATTANSMQVNGTATSNANTVTGIYSTASSLYTPAITNNQVRNLTNSNTGTSTTTIGITVSNGGMYTVNGNTIYNLTNPGTTIGSGTSSSVSGILYTTGVTVPVSVSQNTIYNLSNTSAGATVVTGIYYNGGTNNASTVAKNNIYNLIAGTGASTIVGMHIASASGPLTISNNMIRLGYNVSGGSITNASAIHGILKDNTGASFVYHNSIYIGGIGVTSTAVNTHAYRKSATSGNDNLRNNIFVNARTNAATGGKHYAYWLGVVNGSISNYNLFYAPSGVLFSLNSADEITFAGWKGLTGNPDLNSAVAEPNFAGATAAMANLHLASPSPAEGGGIDIPTITDDIDGDIRAANTPVDLGADATIVAQQDIYPPTISYTAIPTQATCSGTITNVQVTVADPGTGLSLTVNKPRMYIRKSSGTPTTAWGIYPSAEGVFVSGNSNVSVWNFSIDYVALGISVSPVDQFEYYFVAQDQSSTPNVGYSQQNAATPLHSDVATQVTPPNFALNAGGVFAISNPLSGTVTVGISGTFATFNGPSGLFNALNTRGLNGNLVVEVVSDVNESGLYQPLGVIPEYCGVGYSILIRPSAATIRTVYQSTGGNPMIALMGCKRVTFDGAFNGSGKYLLFRQQQQFPTFYFNGVNSTATEYITIKNCSIEGMNQATNGVGPGVISFAGLLGIGSAIENIVIDSNTISNRSDIAQIAANAPHHLVYGGGFNATSLPLKSNISITNNSLFNFSDGAVSFIQNSSGGGIGDSITISGNSIFEPITFATYQYVVWLESGNGKGHIIANNKIGGNALPATDINGTWTNNKTDGEIMPIYTLNGGTTPNDGVQITGNIISGMNITGTAYTNFIGIRNEGGAVTIANNLIGSASVINSIRNSGNGNGFSIHNNTATIGIWNQAAEEAVISYNAIANITATSAFSYIVGIEHGGNQIYNGFDYRLLAGGKATITDNSIFNLNCAGTLQNSALPSVMVGIFSYTGNANGNLIAGNTLCNLNAIANTSNSVKAYGVTVGITGLLTSQGGVVERNVIYNLNVNSSGALAELNGLVVAEGNWTVANNSISLSNSTYSTKSPFVAGIQDWTISGTTNSFYHNSIYIGGALSSGINSSYAYYRAPLNLDINYGVMHASDVDVKNNIFFNDRTGGSTNNIAVGNLNVGNSNDAAIGWNSDYNFIITRNANQVGRWGVTTSGDRNFANWKTTSNGDANSVTATIAGTSSATQVNPADLFTSTANGNLRINTSPPNSPYPFSFVRNAGTPIATITTDIDTDPRDSLTPDLGWDEFTDCSTPVISMTANGVSAVSTICSGSGVILNVTPSGSGANCAGTYEYAISSGGLYWNGSSFSSSTPIYSTTYSSASFTPTAPASYVATIACSADQTCRSNSNSVTVNILGSVVSVNAAIGTPANGASHYMTVSWPAVTSATGYDVDYSNNGSTWTNVVSNLSTTTFNHNTGDSPNIPTYYRVRPRTTSVTCNYTAMSIPVYTACDAPELPLVNGVTTNSLNVTLQTETPVINSSYTTYSIFCTTTNQYVQADGSLGIAEIFQTASQWGTITVTGLTLNTSYCFYAKARNMDGDVRSGGNALIPVQQFNSNVISNSVLNPTNVWWTPNSCTSGLQFNYVSVGGCIGGAAEYSGVASQSGIGCFLRSPLVNCSGLNEVVMELDLSNSYRLAHISNDAISFSLYSNSGGYLPSSSIKVNNTNFSSLPFSVVRSCERLSVAFDISGVAAVDKTSLLLFINSSHTANNTAGYYLRVDNISISQEIPTSCATTISCIAPAITTQPVVPTTVCANSGLVTISVAATGTGLTYQWRKNGSNIATGGIYSVNLISNGSTLTITNPAITDAGSYDVIVSGVCSPSVMSNAVVLTVNTAISGLVVNANSPVCEGSDLTLSVGVSTGTGISWTWSGPGFSANIQSPTLIGILEVYNEGIYTVNASNVCNTVSGNTSVNVQGNIIGLVANTNVTQICTIDTLVLTATYIGNQLPGTDVQWSWIGPNSFTANTQNTFRTSMDSNDGGTYEVFATNACGVQSAGSANITVDEFIEADAGPEDVTNVCGALTTQLNGNSYGAGSGAWSEISAGNTSFNPANTDSNALITTDAYGLKQYRWTITNGACISEDDVRYFFNPAIIATVDLAGCNFTNADSVFINVTASGGNSTLAINPPPDNELKLDVNGTKVYTSPMDGVQRTYTISDGICNISANVTSPMGHPTDIPYVSTNGTITADCYDNSFTKWLTFRDVNNDAILSVNDNGQNLGKISASVYRDTVEPMITQAASGACHGVEQLAMKRHFVLKSNAPQPFASDVSVRLYFSEAELNDLVAATQANDIGGDECTQYDNLTGLSDLYVTKYSGADEDGDYTNNSASGIYRVYTSGDATLQPAAHGFPTIFANGQNHHYVELNVREFSEFWLHGSSTGSALPVEMIYLNAEGVDNEYIKLTWATALEINNNGFVIERSTDGEHWESIGWIDGHNNATTQNDYTYDDHTVSHNIRYYYRLKQIDNDGAYEYTGLVSAIISAAESVFTVKDFTPNPALNLTTLVVVSPAVQNIQLDVYNAIGQKMYSNILGLLKGTNNTTLNVSDWAAGTYTAVVQFNNKVYSKKLVITK